MATSAAQFDDEYNITARLFEHILNMTESEQRSLLRQLEEKSKWRRENQRKPCFITVDYANRGRVYRDFVKNINTGGVFIETSTPFPIGQKIALSLSSPGFQNHIKVNGEVVRNDTRGIGVKFSENSLDTTFKSFVENI